MKRTKKAQKWIDAMDKIFASYVICGVIFRAEAIARAKGSKRIGKNHLEQALDELSS